MGRQALSQSEIEDFRERLVAVATHLFAERGYDGVTLRAIAAALGCSPMTPYRYFRDKQEIFAAVRAATYDEFSRSQEEAAASAAAPETRLVALGRAYLRFAEEHPDMYRLMFGLSQPNPEGFAELRKAQLRAFTPLRNAIGDAIDAGELAGDPDTVAHVFWAGVHGVASLHLAGKLNYGRSFADIAEPMLANLFLGGRPASR